ncbi:MAG: hypothetical protein CM15mP117_14990 [Alphaproteobacteria bacterium]|nr:MAG: hypothetical protein CM15mP117_14990 [Alphaproteobacteria bacterium]
MVAENIAQQLERRVGFRRAMKRAVQSAMRLGALGVESIAPAVLGVQKLHVQSGIARVEFHYILYVQKLIMQRPLRLLPMVQTE